MHNYRISAKLSLVFLSLAFLYACNSKSKDSLILGQWYNESMQVELNALGGKSDSTFSISSGQWESVLNIKPILTTYTVDGGYSSRYTDLDGRVVRSTLGQWTLIGDSLFLTEEGNTTAYFFLWLEGRGSFKGFLDWDGDGQSDDLYTGIQIKQ